MTSIKFDAYERLVAARRDARESFSKVIRRAEFDAFRAWR
jgi:predicted CopG family antitoxin